jgi:hypothetical protein
MAKQSLPRLSLEHLHRLTDDTGLFQHAKFTIPLRSEGYTADDNARALIVANKYYALNRDAESLRLLDRYLAFVLHSQNDDGIVRNFMNFNRTWQKAEPVHDALGRVIWAFGELLAKPPSKIYIPIVKERIDISAPLIEKQYPRGLSYSILGLAGYLKQFPDAGDIRECMKKAADKLVLQYEQNHQPGPPKGEVSPSALPMADWPWFEDILTYDNAIMPCALFTAATTLKEKKYLDVAQKTCDFLLANTITKNPLTTLGTGHFSFVGCQGWFPKGKPKVQFDQQPIEAASTILMLKAAYKATKDKKYLALQRKAFNWFLGENDLGVPLYDSKSKGCSDGLGAEGINLNEGAESTLSFLLSRLLIADNPQ